MNDIAFSRLKNQQIFSSKFSSVKELVSQMGAMQAQDYAMAKWAIGLRVPGSTDEGIEKAIDNAEIFRTHLLRPTWHFVAADDIRWMLSLSAPQINKITATYNKNLELDEKTLSKTNKIIEKVLQGKHLTRDEIMQEINTHKISTDSLRAAHIMFHAEMNQLVCNGIKKGKQLTYALLDEQIPSTTSYNREEALSKLACKYFRSHGLATLKDFVWWSGLTVSDAKKGLENTRHLLHKEIIGEQEYWTGNSFKKQSVKNDGIHFLPAFDEFLIAYKDRTASMNMEHFKHAFTLNGIFKPIIVMDGKVVGIWKRSFKKNQVQIETTFFDKAHQADGFELKEAAKKYGDYMQMEVKLV